MLEKTLLSSLYFLPNKNNLVHLLNINEMQLRMDLKYRWPSAEL